MAVRLTPELSRRLAVHVQALDWQQRDALYTAVQNAATVGQVEALLPPAGPESTGKRGN